MTIDRRTTLKWMLTAAASVPLLDVPSFAEQTAAQRVSSGYGNDPDLARMYKPGDLWPLILTQRQRMTAAALSDLIIPADEQSPAASAVGVVDFIDEWISAPYPRQQADRQIVVDGLEWIDREANRRFNTSFAGLSEPQQRAICDDICYVPRAEPRFAAAARFFARYRELTAGGFYTTPIGFKDLQYVGNTPTVTFDGPPREVLSRVGLD